PHASFCWPGAASEPARPTRRLQPEPVSYGFRTQGNAPALFDRLNRLALIPTREKTRMKNHLVRCALLASSFLAAWPALAADVTPERLANPDREPHNWLMNHRSYDAQRYSPLARINKDTVKNLK